jgi:hypothetical protein
MGQGSSLSRRGFIADSVKLGVAAGAASASLSGCERPNSAISGGFIGPNFAKGHQLKVASQDVPRKATSAARQAKIVILGAGIAGLGAAWSLRQQGISDFVVLELEAVAGGNSRSHQINHIACPMGAHYLPVPLDPHGADLGLASSSSNGLEPVRLLLAELGLMHLRSGRWQVSAEGERHLCHSPQERLFFRGSWQEGLLPLADVGEPSLQAYRRFAALIQDFQRGGGFQLPMGTSAAAAITASRLSERLKLDSLSFKAWLDQQGLTDQHLHWYLDYCCRDDYGAGSSSVSAWAGVHYFASRHGFQAPGENAREDGSAASGVFTWPQGNAWLVEKISAMLGDKLLTDRLATGVERKAHGLQVTAQHADTTEQWDCEHCILAIPLFLSQRLLSNGGHEPTTFAALQALTAKIEHSSWLVANAYLDRELRDRGGAPPAWDNVIYSGEGLGYVNAKHQSLSQSSTATILTYYQALGEGRAARNNLLERSWDSWRLSLAKEFQSAHPDLNERLKHLDIARFGHAMAVPKPGWHSEPLRLARAHLLGRPSGIRFAHTDLAGYSVFEEAFTLGVRAAQSLGYA